MYVGVGGCAVGLGAHVCVCGGGGGVNNVCAFVHACVRACGRACVCVCVCVCVFECVCMRQWGTSILRVCAREIVYLFGFLFASKFRAGGETLITSFTDSEC